MGLRIGKVLVEQPPDWEAMDRPDFEAAWNSVLTDSSYFYQSQD
jgi:hypothetical protein